MTAFAQSLRAACAGALLFAALPVAATNGAKHPEKLTTTEECNALQGTDKTGERSACYHCVQRPAKHAYHFTSRPGRRCKPDLGD